jgi:dTDP-glucose 4,6-dehydratase/UDP-glucuronate decarboxylase
MARISSVIREDARHVAQTLSRALEPLAGSTLLVTGASGFLCSYFLDVIVAANEELLARPCRVIGLDNFQSSLPERLEHLRGRSDVDLVRHDMRQRYEPDFPLDWIIHGASIASPTFYRRFPLETIDVNVGGTRHLLERARHGGVKSLVILSTSEIYGDPDPAHVPTSEDYRGNVSCTGPRACYDESKRLAETLCWNYFQLYRTPVKVVRPFNVYGPGQRLDDARIIPDLISAALERRPLVLFSDGRATRSLCYIRDAIAAMLHVLLSGADGEAFNVGNDEEEISMRDLAARVSQVAGPPALPIEFRHSADPNYNVDSPQRRCPNLAKLRRLAPWRPEVGLTEGLERTLRSYKEVTASSESKNLRS